MGRISKGPCRHQLRPTPYPIPSSRYALEKTDWEQAICSVCLEAPHNAVLLLCSSYDKGCRPYMCGTSFRHSNCLDLFKNAHAKQVVTASANPQEDSATWSACNKSELAELACPLCRGEVKGWTVVEPARRYLNTKRRSCVQDGCCFVGTYRDLKKHVKAKHRRAKPRKVDPVLEAKWRALEMQTAQQDVMSTIRSSMPRSVVLGDYVIDMDSSGGSDFDDFNDDSFGDPDGGDRRFPRGRRRRSNGDVRHQLFYILLEEGARLSRVRGDNGAQEEAGGNGSMTDGIQIEEDALYNSIGGRSRGRPLSLIREGRRRQRWGRGRRRSEFASEFDFI